MTETGDRWEEDVDEFLSEAEEEELKLLVSLNDRHNSFESDEIMNQDEKSIRPKIWGLAIEKGILKEKGTGYKLNARSEISQFLSGDWNSSEDSSEEDSKADQIEEEEIPNINREKAKWSTKDKMAAAAGFVGILGFSFGPIRDIIYGVLGLFLNPLLSVLPFFAVVFIIAIFTSIWSTLVRERIIDADASEFREYIDALKGDDGGGMFSTPENATEEEESKIMQAQQDMMKAQMKPFGWTMVVTIPVIIWVFTTANLGGVGTVVFPILGEKAWSGTVVGPIQTWIIWYASSSIVLSQIVKRIIDF
jgi:uncharacterized membrane protein (DUF106 family)